MTALEALQRCKLFSGFTATGLQIIASVAKLRNFAVGTPLFSENMTSESMLVIAQGKVALSAVGERGILNLDELGPGDWMGELSLMSPTQRLCTATALAPVTAFEITHEEFQRLLAVKPQACAKLLMSICTHLGQKLLANREALRSLANTN